MSERLGKTIDIKSYKRTAAWLCVAFIVSWVVYGIYFDVPRLSGHQIVKTALFIIGSIAYGAWMALGDVISGRIRHA